MNKTAVTTKRSEILYFFGAAACAGLLYIAYTWYSEMPEKKNVSQSRTEQMQEANSAYAQGSIAYKAGNYKAAIDSFHQAIRIYPQHEQALINTSLAFANLGNYDQAISHALQAIQVNKNNFSSHVMLGKFYEQIKQPESAKASFHTAVKINPNIFEAHYFLSRLFTQEKTNASLIKAIEHGKKAVALSPNAKDGHMALGDAYLMAGQPINAREQYQQVLEKSPKDTQALLATGKTYEQQQMIDNAITYFKDAINSNPNYPQAHVSLAGAQFMKGNLKEGFKEYEWRWKLTNQPGLEKIRWDGTNPAGKKVLLLAENGLGDILQYVRFAKLLKEKGATVIVHTPKPLLSLFKQCDYIDQVVLAGTENPPFDVLTSMQSIPYLFDIDERVLPNKPYLQADKKLITYWADKLSSDKNFKIGIIWAPGDDSYLALDQKRAIELEMLAPLSKLPNVSFYSLQIGETSRKQIKNTSFKIHGFDESFDRDHGPFMDTAAVMKNMDLIISVDTSVSHLAGALGVKTWLLLPYGADVRWMINKQNTVWYPSFTLFQQKKMGDWKNVIDIVSNRLKTLLQEK